MARRRKESREGWPKNLYQNNNGYMWHKNPITGKSTGLGRNEDEAFALARVLNGDAENGYEFTSPKPLLSSHEIIEGSRKWSLLVGVYFLIKGEEIIYVGASVHAARRLSEHRMNGIDFDCYHIIECKETELSLLEKLYIAKFRPPMNKVSLVWKDEVSEEF